MPISSATLGDLAYYYNTLIKEAELDEQSFELYEQFQEKRITVENLTIRLREEEQSPEEQKELLNELAGLMAEVEELSNRMEKLDRA